MPTVDIPNEELVAVGKYKGVHVSLDDLKAIVKNTNEVKNLTPLVKLGHSKTQKLLHDSGFPAAGYVKNLRVDEVKKKLIGDLTDIPKVIADIIKAKGYKQKSAEIALNFVDKATNTFKGMTLTGLAILGNTFPECKTLQDLQTLYCSEEDNENLEVINLSEEDNEMTDNEKLELQKKQEEEAKAKAEAEAKLKLEQEQKAKDEETKATETKTEDKKEETKDVKAEDKKEDAKTSETKDKQEDKKEEIKEEYKPLENFMKSSEVIAKQISENTIDDVTLDNFRKTFTVLANAFANFEKIRLAKQEEENKKDPKIKELEAKLAETQKANEKLAMENKKSAIKTLNLSDDTKITEFIGKKITEPVSNMLKDICHAINEEELTVLKLSEDKEVNLKDKLFEVIQNLPELHLSEETTNTRETPANEKPADGISIDKLKERHPGYFKPKEIK